MNLLSVILLSIAANLDNLSIGLAYGIRKVRIPALSNLIISSVSGLFTMITCFAGGLLGGVMPKSLGGILGGSMIGVMGIWVIAGYVIDQKKKAPPTELKPKASDNPHDGEFLEILQHPDKADTDYSGDISVKESVVLGIALALNCLATGLGAGMVGLNVIGITLATIVFSFFTIYFGLLIGKKCVSRFRGDKAALIAGLLLIIIGIYEAIT